MRGAVTDDGVLASARLLPTPAASTSACTSAGSGAVIASGAPVTGCAHVRRQACSACRASVAHTSRSRESAIPFQRGSP